MSAKIRLTVRVPGPLMRRIELACSGTGIEEGVIAALLAAFPFTAPNHGEPLPRMHRARRSGSRP